MKTENRHINIQEPEGMMLLRYIKDTASNEEKSYIEAWLEADENNKRILLQTARIYYANNAMERIASRNPLIAYEKLEQRLAKRTRLYWLKRFSVAAACIIAIIGLSTLFSHSVLSYPMSYDQKERKVCLSGEAYFKVTHNEKQPFIVSTSGDQHRVRVLGTEFNIQAYGDENIISTTLVTGSVNLEVKNKSGNVSHRTLLPSEKAICNLDKEEISVMKINTMYETAWMDGKLMFKDTPLPEALKKLSYYYNVEFVIQDAEIKSYCLTGILDNRLLSQTLDYLRISSNIDYRIEDMKTDDSKGTNRTRVILWKGK